MLSSSLFLDRGSQAALILVHIVKVGDVQSVGGAIKSYSAVIGLLCSLVAVEEAHLWVKWMNEQCEQPPSVHFKNMIWKKKSILCDLQYKKIPVTKLDNWIFFCFVSFFFFNIIFCHLLVMSFDAVGYMRVCAWGDIYYLPGRWVQSTRWDRCTGHSSGHTGLRSHTHNYAHSLGHTGSLGNLNIQHRKKSLYNLLQTVAVQTANINVFLRMRGI